MEYKKVELQKLIEIGIMENPNIIPQTTNSFQ